jgi:hypothetical protein
MEQSIPALRTGAGAKQASLLSQALFLAGALTIIAAGSWSLYMQDAPYHPEAGESLLLASH